VNEHDHLGSNEHAKVGEKEQSSTDSGRLIEMVSDIFFCDLFI